MNIFVHRQALVNHSNPQCVESRQSQVCWNTTNPSVLRCFQTSVLSRKSAKKWKTQKKFILTYFFLITAWLNVFENSRKSDESVKIIKFNIGIPRNDRWTSIFMLSIRNNFPPVFGSFDIIFWRFWSFLNCFWSYLIDLNSSNSGTSDIFFMVVF